ncbi:MAG TPA: branched-chain amino acid ABC transporter permease [Solirubrobacteraceae bacterium]|nr:branched-chain amino acid ABC transporter permease [Solirubrobacteraceae bacterium]
MNLSLLFGALVLGLLTGGVYGVMASGLSLTFGVMRIINVGHAALVITGAFISYEVFRHLHLDPFAGLVITMPLMFVIGVVLEVLFIRPLKTDREELSVLVTWALALALEGVLGYFFGTDLVQTTVSYGNSTFVVGGVHIAYVYIYGFLLAVAAMAALAALLYRTNLGAAIRATMLNRQAAQLIGIDVERVSAISFGIGAALAGVGGTVYGIVNAFNPDSHYDLIGHLLVIVVLGGVGSMRGAFLAALLIICIQDITQVMISPDWADLSFFVVLTIMLVVRPQGFFGVRVREAT